MKNQPSKQKSRGRSRQTWGNDPTISAAKSAAERRSRKALFESLTFRSQADGLSAEALKRVFGPSPPIRVLEAAALLGKAYHGVGYDLFVTVVPFRKIPAAMEDNRSGRAQIIAEAKHRLAMQQNAVSLLLKVPSEIVDAALGCFESYEAAASFFICPSPALRDRIPAQVALSPRGKTELLHLLGRMEHGIFM